MTKIYTKSEFQELEFDSKCVIIESLLTNAYFEGQEKIGFQVEIDENNNLLPVPSEIKEMESKKFEALILDLTEKLFAEKIEIEFDTEY
ncbi:hypothetical protein ESY86_07425 [Subsaximicrobium wynnwilliamsii]|uniref:Uncharacterized protein n=1 Tax=Subsaximicrobium wynnwilliamsii TaxID=291179 RepID=A0A5C6ZJ70_9FLAO|nr:hypothetical protein [Subsaximicrobium wynnwilliamsii]TXD83868.1 hypothetical protein ESY87_07585 [Subsaximicrobium wynnwilliamsii]TXD89609.1 hypothetical protein ESY86_07425 [Subsaximicrobium wynnwilliamsii]TXE02600.1 hypothetical protein ESY88_11420 [Subsaximicrobium wynnwilliamsii]